MSEGSSSQLQFTQLFRPEIILLLLGLAGHLLTSFPLESRRPETPRHDLPPPPSPDAVHAVHGRLWEDPLTTAGKDWKELTKEPGSAGTIASFKDPSKLRSITRALLERDPNLLCLPVLVSGGPYVDDIEQRMRTQYAVVSALTTCDYAVEFPQRLTYAVAPVRVAISAVKQSREVDLVVPMKLYKRTKKVPQSLGKTTSEIPNHVLVLWINEMQLGDRPLTVITQILDHFFERRNDNSAKLPQVRLIGPAGSDTLNDMAKEERKWNEEPTETLKPLRTVADFMQLILKPKEPLKRSLDHYQAEMYSPRATVGVRSVATLGNKDDAWQLSNFLENSNRSSGLKKVVRSIGTDELLITQLIKELKLRDKLSSGGSIVLSTEQDSLYARAFAAEFKQKCLAEDQKINVVQANYLRGVDGRVPNSKSDSSAEERSGRAKSPGGGTSFDNAEDVHSTGQAQFDYLRRLEHELLAFDHQERQEGRKGIQAIGVVGTDLYDKLLVLRALRKRFPDACFFTTDLDAELSQPGEYQTTRNLVIASHFGLQLHEKLQRGVPPFRDSYQTSTFLAVLMALADPTTDTALGTSRDDPWERSTKPVLEPLIFELGRHGPYQLTVAPQGTESQFVIQPPSPRQTPCLTLGRACLLGIAATWLSLCLYLLVRKVRAGVRKLSLIVQRNKTCSVLMFVVLIVLILGICWDHGRPNGEPFAWNEGISVWPPTLIRFVVLLVSILSIIQTESEMQHERLQLPKHWLLDASSSRSAGGRHLTLTRTLRGLWRALVQDIKRGFESKSKSPIARRVFPRFWRSELDLPNNSDSETQPLTAPRIVREYLDRTELRYRWINVSILSLSYLMFGMFWFRLSGDLPTNPYRGGVSEVASKWVLVVAVIGMVFLVFQAIDRLHLCQRFIKLLGRHSGAWPCERRKQLTQNRTATPNDLQPLLTVRLIAEHTNVVLKRCEYPFIALALMVAARMPMFDYLSLPIPLIGIIGLMVLGLMWSWYGLRKAAENARESLLVRLQDRLSAAYRTPNSSGRVDQIKQLIQDIKETHQGAFEPIMNDPLFRGLTILFGSSGGFLLLQQLLQDVIF